MLRIIQTTAMRAMLTPNRTYHLCPLIIPRFDM